MINFFVILPLLIGIYLNSISSKLVKLKAEKRLKNPYDPLPDIIHDIFPKINLHIPDLLLILIFIYSLYKYKNLINVQKNILCIGICTIIRSFSTMLTLFPTCMDKPLNNSKSFYESSFLSTHDLMFSGHSLFFIGLGNILNNIFISIIGPLLLVISRQHYTIDVCVSGLVYFTVYQYV